MSDIRFLFRALLLAVPVLTVVGTEQLFAQVSPKVMGKPEAEFAEPYTSVRGVRELSDGRVLLVDIADKLVHLIDFRKGSPTLVGREGSGPNEYRMPSSVLALPGDTTLISDPLNSRFFRVGPTGSAAGTVVANLPSSSGLTSSGSGDQLIGLMSVRTTDALGRFYSQGSGISRGAQGPSISDSVPVIRTDRGTSKSDTLAWLSRTGSNVAVRSSQRGSSGPVSLSAGSAYPSEDGWAVLPDGRLAVVRSSEYRVEIYPASGKGSVSRGSAVSYTPLPVTEADKQQWRERLRNSTAISVGISNQGGSPVISGGATSARGLVNEPDSWPAVMPAFVPSQVYALPDGKIWVGRYRSVADNRPLFDVFDSSGKHTGQVVFPARTRVVGFGKGVVYTVRQDDDDLQYLQRWRL